MIRHIGGFILETHTPILRPEGFFVNNFTGFTVANLKPLLYSFEV
jgi:hypothetical protein